MLQTRRGLSLRSGNFSFAKWGTVKAFQLPERVFQSLIILAAQIPPNGKSTVLIMNANPDFAGQAPPAPERRLSRQRGYQWRFRRGYRVQPCLFGPCERPNEELGSDPRIGISAQTDLLPEFAYLGHPHKKQPDAQGWQERIEPDQHSPVSSSASHGPMTGCFGRRYGGDPMVNMALWPKGDRGCIFIAGLSGRHAARVGSRPFGGCRRRGDTTARIAQTDGASGRRLGHRPVDHGGDLSGRLCDHLTQPDRYHMVFDARTGHSMS